MSPPPIERSWARESPRDQTESAFTPILRRLLHRTTGVLAVCFVDDEGETVDYCAALPPYDVKVNGAQMRVVMGNLGPRMQHAGGGESWLLHVSAGGRDLLARRLSDEYMLIVLTKPRGITRRLLAGVEQTVGELRREAGIPVPHWEPAVFTIGVEVREAIGWPYAPAAFLDEGRRVVIADVLGRWTEGTGPRARVCFRVRTDDGEELTLVHDREIDRWERPREKD